MDREQPFDLAGFLGRNGQGRTIAAYRARQPIYGQGDAADCVFYVQTGKVKFTVISERGREAVVAILGAGQFFGEGSMGGQPQRMSAADALTECKVMRLERSVVAHTLRTEPAFKDLFVKHILTRTLRLEEDLVDQLFNSSERRLARALLLLANFGQEGPTESRIAHVSQETLAEMIGTTRSRVSHFMNRFRKLGFIDYDGAIDVHPSLLNFVLQDAPQTGMRLPGIIRPALQRNDSRESKCA